MILSVREIAMDLLEVGGGLLLVSESTLSRRLMTWNLGRFGRFFNNFLRELCAVVILGAFVGIHENNVCSFKGDWGGVSGVSSTLVSRFGVLNTC